MKQDWLQERMFLGTSGVVGGDNAGELFLEWERIVADLGGVAFRLVS